MPLSEEGGGNGVALRRFAVCLIGDVSHTLHRELRDAAKLEAIAAALTSRFQDSLAGSPRAPEIPRDHASSGEITLLLARSRFLWRDYASSGKSDGGSGPSGLIQPFSKLFQTLRAYQPIIAGPKVSPLTPLR